MNQSAELLQGFIVDALCQNGVSSEWARKWLWIDDEPTPYEIRVPEPYSFISVCLELGLDWRQLRKHLQDAIALDRPRKQHLWLVPTSELGYNDTHEEKFRNSPPISKSPKMQRRVHLTLVSTPKRSSQTN